MSSEMAEAIRQLIYEKGISEDLVVKTIEDSLLAAYKKRYGTAENAVVRFRDEYEGVDIFAKKTIVEELDDPVLEISLEDARAYSEEAEVGDILELPVDPREFDLQSVMLAKQTTRQNLREISRDTLFAEYQIQGRGNHNRILPAGPQRQYLCRSRPRGRRASQEIPIPSGNVSSER